MFIFRYLQLVSYLADASQHVDDFMAGKLWLYDIIPVKDDCTYQALLVPSVTYDPLCKVMLEVIFPALLKVSNKLFQDHLPGGRYGSLENSPQLQQETKSVAKHNKHSESVFVYADFLKKVKPNDQTLATEAYVLYTFNKTAEWIAAKTSNE